MNILDNLSEKYSPPQKAAFAIYSLVSNQKVLLALRRARVPRIPQFRNTSPFDIRVYFQRYIKRKFINLEKSFSIRTSHLVSRSRIIDDIFVENKTKQKNHPIVFKSIRQDSFTIRFSMNFFSTDVSFLLHIIKSTYNIGCM